MCRFAFLLLVTFVTTLGAASQLVAMPRYEHIFIIIAENKGYAQIIRNTNDAPILNELASQYGLATNFYGEVHPSEGNYVAMLGGSTFGIHDDDAWYCQQGQRDAHCSGSGETGYPSHLINARSLMDQLEEAKLTWKGYFEDLPAPGSTVIYNPSREREDSQRADFLYASKHNGFLNFNRVHQDPRMSEKIVPASQLKVDLDAGVLPNYAHIVRNQCNEMHGLSGSKVERDCVLRSRDPQTLSAVIRRGDRAIGEVVKAITASSIWKGSGNVAVIITWDEDDHDTVGVQGCCGFEPSSAANFGGGHIPTIVMTNHGPRNIADPTPYNHYSLLRTCEEAFGVTEYLGLAAADEKGVKPMTPLFEVGSQK